MQNLGFYFDLIPVVLAIGVMFQLGTIKITQTDYVGRLINYLISISCMVLIIAQLSWSFSNYIQHDLQGTWFANHLWFVFNSLTMIIFSINVTKR